MPKRTAPSLLLLSQIIVFDKDEARRLCSSSPISGKSRSLLSESLESYESAVLVPTYSHPKRVAKSDELITAKKVVTSKALYYDITSDHDF